MGRCLSIQTIHFGTDPVADLITSVPNIPRATGETRALKFAGGVGRCAPAIWVMGGGRTPPNPSNEVDIDCPDTWTMGPPFVTARRNFPTDTDGGGVSFGTGRVWLAGGYASDGVTPLRSMETYCHTVPTPSEPPPMTPTATFTATPTATLPPPTPTTTPTASATPTVTPPGVTPTPSDPGGTPTATPTATATATVTVTPVSPTPTARPSPTPRPVLTPRPRPTPPPRPWL